MGRSKGVEKAKLFFFKKVKMKNNDDALHVSVTSEAEAVRVQLSKPRYNTKRQDFREAKEKVEENEKIVPLTTCTATSRHWLHP